MRYFVKPLNNGEFELIDEELLHLYPNQDDLLALSQEAYAEFLTKSNHLTTFENGQFIFTEITPDKLTEQAEAWEQIKKKRFTNGRNGVYVASVDKWFHSDDASRQQYTFLRTLKSIPANTMWKTMDNSFVKMTKTLLDELSLAMFAHEQADFANAERHRLAMLQAEKPLEYDYSTGWQEVFNG